MVMGLEGGFDWDGVFGSQIGIGVGKGIAKGDIG